MKSEFGHFKYRDELPKKERLLRLIWKLTWLLFFRTTPRWTLHGWRRSMLRCFGAQIGEGSLIAPSCFVWAPWKLKMGDYSVMAEYVDCYNMGPIFIGSKVAVSQRAFLCTGSHDIRSLMRPLIVKEIMIEDHVWICSQVFIGPGVKVGQGAVVAACACVVKNVEPWTIVGGNPAVFIKKRLIAEELKY